MNISVYSKSVDNLLPAPIADIIAMAVTAALTVVYFVKLNKTKGTEGAAVLEETPQSEEAVPAVQTEELAPTEEDGPAEAEEPAPSEETAPTDGQ